MLMKKFKTPTIIMGFIHAMSFLGMIFVYVIWYLQSNGSIVSASSNMPLIFAITSSLCAYVCPIIYALSFVYFIVMLVLSFIDSFKTKETK